MKLLNYFLTNTKKMIHKPQSYFDIYERYFSPFAGREVKILEIGVSHGGSLQMWKHYFGLYSKIVGIDINPVCKQFEEAQITSMNYGIGAHTANPQGNVIIDNDSGLRTLHMNFLSRQYSKNRYARNRKRHTKRDIDNKWGLQSFWSDEQIDNFFEENIPKLIKLT